MRFGPVFINPVTFISLINLDLGFEICFYEGMSELAETGLQIVFPLYLWLLMFIIIMVEKYNLHTKTSTHSAIPVLATLILLSYSKLRTIISVFSFIHQQSLIIVSCNCLWHGNLILIY